MFFKGNLHFLSNFYPVKVEHEGFTFDSVEAAFQAAKTLDENIRLSFERLSPQEAKKQGRLLKLRPDWEQVKNTVMAQCLMSKFIGQKEFLYGQTDLITKLMAVPGHIEEGNYWHDNYWGVCYCEKCGGKKGNNQLGKMLMFIRDTLKKGR